MRERSYNKNCHCEICGKRTVNGHKRCRKHVIFTIKHRNNLRLAQLKRVKEGRHNNYKGGISVFTRSRHANIMDTIKGRLWRKSVFIRDNWTCQMPNCQKHGVVLEAHHIIPIREIDTPNYIPLVYCEENGITLCRKCHNKTKFGRENKFIDLFSQLVIKKYQL